MSDTLTGSQSIEAMFVSPGFGEALTEWQRARLYVNASERRMADYLSSLYASPDMTPYKIDDEIPRDDELVSYYLEIDDETFDEIPRDDELVSYRKQWKSWQAQERIAKSALLATATDFGIGEFASYGLRLHTGINEDISASLIKQKVLEAERDLSAVDTFIRENAGKILTVFNLGVCACRLGNGGISLQSGKCSSVMDLIAFPVSKDTKAYYMGLSNDMPELYTEDEMIIQANRIHSISSSGNAQLHNTWRAFYDLDAVFRSNGAVLAIGDVEDAQPEWADDMNRQYNHQVFQKIRRVGLAAMHGAESNT